MYNNRGSDLFENDKTLRKIRNIEEIQWLC